MRVCHVKDNSYLCVIATSCLYVHIKLRLQLAYESAANCENLLVFQKRTTDQTASDSNSSHKMPAVSAGCTSGTCLCRVWKTDHNATPYKFGSEFICVHNLLTGNHCSLGTSLPSNSSLLHTKTDESKDQHDESPVLESARTDLCIWDFINFSNFIITIVFITSQFLPMLFSSSLPLHNPWLCSLGPPSCPPAVCLT